jgi:hypothetical protein
VNTPKSDDTPDSNDLQTAAGLLVAALDDRRERLYHCSSYEPNDEGLEKKKRPSLPESAA